MDLHRFVEQRELGGEIKNELIIYVNLILKAILKEKKSLARNFLEHRDRRKFEMLSSLTGQWSILKNVKYIRIFFTYQRNRRNPSSTTHFEQASTSNIRKLAYIRIINDSLKNSPLK